MNGEKGGGGGEYGVRDNDQMWGVNEKAVPPVSTPVEIIFKLVPPANPAPKP